MQYKYYLCGMFFHMNEQYTHVHWLERTIITVHMDISLCDSMQFSRYVRLFTRIPTYMCIYKSLSACDCGSVCECACLYASAHVQSPQQGQSSRLVPTVGSFPLGGHD